MSDEKLAIFAKNAKLVLNKLGIKAADLEKDEINVADIVEKTAVGIVEHRKGDIEIETRTQATTAAFKKAEKLLASAFGLDAKKYEALEKGQFDAMVKDAKALLEEKAEAPAGDKNADLLTLKKQYSELQELHKAALKEAGELKSEKERLPELLAKERKAVRIGYEKDAAISNAMKTLREKGLSPLFTDDMLKAEIFKGGIDLEAIENGENIAFRVAQKINKADGTTEYKPIKKSESQAYDSLSDYAIEKVVKEDWIIKSNPTGGAGTGTGGAGAGANSGGDNGKLDLSKIPPALAKQYGIS
jgi:hypothetical protein